MSIEGKVKTAKFANKWIPKVKQPWHIVCFILNIFLPGIGTILGAMIDKCDCVNVFFGFLQLLTAVLIIGWIWSIAWGYAMWKRNKGAAKYLPRVGRKEIGESSSLVNT